MVVALLRLFKFVKVDVYSLDVLPKFLALLGTSERERNTEYTSNKERSKRMTSTKWSPYE